MIPGHTKFSPDRNFGMIKKRYWKSTINCVDDFVKVVKESSPAGLNKIQCYQNGQGFQYLDIRGSLEKYFQKLPNIARYHHFLFSADSLGVVKVQEEANGEFKEFNLWKDKDKIIETIKEVRELVFTTLTPTSSKPERQQYLYEKIRPLISEKFKDITCPQPILDNIPTNKKSMNKHNCQETENLFTYFDSIVEYASKIGEPIEKILFSQYLSLNQLKEEDVNQIRSCVLCYSQLKDLLKGLRKYLGIKKPRQPKLENKVVSNKTNKKESAKQPKEVCNNKSVQHKFEMVAGFYCDKLHNFF
jgi:hypothetical protein